MKLPSKYGFIASTLLLVFALSAIFTAAPTVQAASASLSLSPGLDSIRQGEILAVGIYVNAEEPVNAVEANLVYPASLLDFNAIESSEAFGIEAVNSGGGGAVHIERGTLQPADGRKLVATVKFKAKNGTGVAKINFADSSKVVTAGDHTNILSGTIGGSYSFKSLTPPPPASFNPLKKEVSKLPDGRLEGTALSNCKSREKTIRNIMARISDRGQKQFNLYNSIYERTNALYEKKGKTLKDYSALVDSVESNGATAKLVLNAVKSTATSFRCDGDNPKAVIISFKEKLTIEIDALSVYRTSVKYQVLSVKKLEQGTPSGSNQ